MHKIDIFPPKLILTETLVILPQSLHDIILSLELEIPSYAQKLTFLHKMLFFTKRKKHHQKLTLSKMKKFFKIGVSARFSLLPVIHT